MVEGIGDPTGEARGIGAHETPGHTPLEVPELGLQHPAAVLCALLRPKDTHPEPLDEDGEDEPEDEPAQHLDDPEERPRDDAGLGGVLGRGRCGLSGQRLVPP